MTSGGSKNSVRVVCRNSLGSGVKLTLVSSPDWVAVDLMTAEEGTGFQLVEVTARQLVPKGEPRKTGTVVFEASNADSTERIALPVVVEPSN